MEKSCFSVWVTALEPEQGQRLVRHEPDELEQMFNRVQNCVGRRKSKLPGLCAESLLLLYSFNSELPGGQGLDENRVDSVVLGCREEEAQCLSVS